MDLASITTARRSAALGVLIVCPAFDVGVQVAVQQALARLDRLPPL
jgi:hypothetical protein